MKKLWQMILVSAMIVSCACAVACKKNDNADTSCKHEYVETVVPATCETDGYTEHKCSKCGDTYKDNETEKLGHDLTEWAQKTPATCTDAEVLERHCQRTGCEHQETKDGDPKLGHNVVWTVVKPATCTEDGTEHGECNREGCTYTEGDRAITKLGHNYVEDPDDPEAKAATCTEDGVKVEICNREGCGDRKVTTIFALGHIDDGSKANVIAPTCTEDGKTVRHCSRCNTDYDDDIKTKLGHDMELTQTVDVTCLTDGYELWSCKRDGCEHTEKREEEPKLDHAFNDKGECTNGCGKTISDKLTWVNTKYAVTYNETKDRLTMVGGDPGTAQIQQKVKIPAELFAKMKKEGKSQFALIAYKWDGTTPQFGFNLNSEGATSDWKYSDGNVASYSTDVIAITDKMLTDGFEFWALYCDLTQRNPVWGGTVKCTGFDFDIEFIKPFDINDKSMWIRSDFENTAYSEGKAKWIITDATIQGDEDVQKNITISADVFKALKETYGSFKIKFAAKDAGSYPIYGIKSADVDWRSYKYGNVTLESIEYAITEDMLANGYSFTVLYADGNKRAHVDNAPEVNGFEMEIEFIKAFDVNDKSTWIMSEFNSTVYSVEKGKWVINDADPVKNEVKKLITIRPEVFKALSSDINTLKISLYCQNTETQRPRLAIYVGDTKLNEGHAHAGPVVAEITITDEMRTNGYSFYVRYMDNNQIDSAWGGTEIVTGFDLTIDFEQKVALDSETISYTYDDNAAYDGTIFTFNVESAEGSANGGVYFTIGSYGVYYRGGAFRPSTFNGTNATQASHSGQGVLDLATFKKGVQIGISVTIKDENTVTVAVYVNGSKTCEQDIARVSGEIESGTATARVEINTADVSKLVLVA